MSDAIGTYGPPAVVLRLTLNEVAPEAPDHVRVTRVSPARAVKAGGASAASHDRMAPFTLSRPPVIVIDASAGTGSTVLSSASFNASVLKAQCDRTSAAAPETCGVAIDVPLNEV